MTTESDEGDEQAMNTTTDPKDSSQEQPRATRRTLLRAAGIGAVGLTGISQLPEKWKRPLAESVLLPAHAQTTGGGAGGAGGSSSGGGVAF